MPVRGAISTTPDPCWNNTASTTSITSFMVILVRRISSTLRNRIGGRSWGMSVLRNATAARMLKASPAGLADDFPFVHDDTSSHDLHDRASAPFFDRKRRPCWLCFEALLVNHPRPVHVDDSNVSIVAGHERAFMRESKNLRRILGGQTDELLQSEPALIHLRQQLAEIGLKTSHTRRRLPDGLVADVLLRTRMRRMVRSDRIDVTAQELLPIDIDLLLRLGHRKRVGPTPFDMLVGEEKIRRDDLDRDRRAFQLCLSGKLDRLRVRHMSDVHP